jgi:hypothetical protein
MRAFIRPLVVLLVVVLSGLVLVVPAFAQECNNFSAGDHVDQRHCTYHDVPTPYGTQSGTTHQVNVNGEQVLVANNRATDETATADYSSQNEFIYRNHGDGTFDAMSNSSFRRPDDDGHGQIVCTGHLRQDETGVTSDHSNGSCIH